MARVLRCYEHPIAASSALAGTNDTQNITQFVRRVPRKISPITHVIVPQTSGLDPNARISTLRGYCVRYKGKIQENSIRKAKYLFITGAVDRLDNHLGNDWDSLHHVFRENYMVYGPFGILGVKAMYHYDLTNYFTSKEIYSVDKEKTDEQKRQERIDKETKKQIEKQKMNMTKLKIDETTNNLNEYDELMEDGSILDDDDVDNQEQWWVESDDIE